MPSFHHLNLIFALAFSWLLADATFAAAQPLKRDPTPQDYVERNGGGATIVRPGELVLGGKRISCGKWATIVDPNLNDYAASYPQFVILNMRFVAKAPTAVQLWIFSHECGHLFDGPDENKADCFAVRRGRTEGWLTPEGLSQVCTFISSAHADAMHLGGAERCARMRACFQAEPAAKSER